jgi:hypothetical protein
MARQLGTTFSIPITVISVWGSVVHMRPLPSDSTTHTAPVSATAKFAPLIPTVALRNLPRRKRRAAAARSLGASESSDLRPVLVDGGHQDMRGRFVRELDDQLGEIGLERVNADRCQGVVEADLVRGERFDLDGLTRARRGHQRLDDGVGFGRIAGPVHLASAGEYALLEPHQVVIEVRDGVRLDGAAGLAERLPVGQLPGGKGALLPDGRGRLRQVAPQLDVLQGLVRGPFERSGSGCAAAHACLQGRASVEARISATCRVRTPVR